METNYTYEIFEDGYDILNNGTRMLKQRDPYSRLFKPDGTYEENAILHIEDLTKPAPPAPPSPEEMLRADVDYIAIMEDLTLPSQESEEEGE